MKSSGASQKSQPMGVTCERQSVPFWLPPNPGALGVRGQNARGTESSQKCPGDEGQSPQVVWRGERMWELRSRCGLGQWRG